MTTACLRCGSFVSPDELPVPSIGLCAGCLDDRGDGEGRALHYPPPWITWRWVRPVTALGALLGIVVGALMATRASPAALLGPPLIGFVIGAASFEFVGLVAFDLPGRGGLLAWKRHLLESFGFGQAAADSFALVFYAWQPIGLMTVQIPGEYGLLAVSDSGFVFLGVRGTRVARRSATVAKTDLVWVPVFFPPRRGLRLDFDDGANATIIVLDQPSYGANFRAEAAIGTRLRPQNQPLG